MVEVHAPGKLILCGEYAVLSGAPAIAVAVDVRAHARVSSARDGCSFEMAGGGRWRFDWSRDGTPNWSEPAPGTAGRVLEAVAATLAADGIKRRPTVEICLDTRAFQAPSPDGVKLGLGSSAAVTVALVAAWLAGDRGGGIDEKTLFHLGCEAHRRFQGGRGSGVDVAVAVQGGVIMLSDADAAASICQLAWPAGLYWLAAWSGTSASTTQLLARFEDFRSADPAQFDRHMRRLKTVAAAAAQAWKTQDARAVLACLSQYDQALRGLDEAAGIGIYTPAHERLAQTARAAGATYKVSGAGGGDFGVAFADSAEVIGRLSAAYHGQGVTTLAGSTAIPGVAITRR